jgi:CRISPR-associated endonuclease Cas3-HD
LRCVTKLAKGFARGFGETQVETLGWLHDFGKINPNFQAYLHACARGEKAQSEPHAIWGAAFVYKLGTLKPQLKAKKWFWQVFALPILGHERRGKLLDRVRQRPWKDWLDGRIHGGAAHTVELARPRVRISYPPRIMD